MSKGRRRKVYGKVFPITEEEARAYRRADRPRSYKANPIGVTRMSSVNGRGSYRRSARQAAAGKSPTERLSRARSVVRNGKMAGFLKNRPKKSGGATRRASAARRVGAKRATTKSNSRKKVPGTNYYRTSNGRYQNAKGKFVKADTVKRTTKRKSTSKRKSPAKRRVKRNASVGASASYSKGYDSMKRSQAAKKAAATRKRRKTAAKRKAGGGKGSVGRYKRLTVQDPRTGKPRKSYMYKTSKGKRRRIPAKAIVRSGRKTATQIKSGRRKAAARIKREGSAFVANKRKTSARQRRAGKRAMAYMSAKRRGASVKKAKAAALRKVPLKIGDSFKGTTKVGTMKKGSRKRKSTKRKAAPKRRRKASAKRRSPAKRKTRRSYKKNARRSMAKRSAVRRNRRKVAKRRSPVRRNRRRTYRRNPDWMQTFKKAFVSGMFVGVGFLSHKVITNLAADPIFDLFKKSNGEPAATQGTDFNLDHWKKPIVGAGVLAIGIPLVGMVAKKRAVELGAGMVASWLHSVIVSASLASKQENFIKAVGDIPKRSDWSGRSWPYPSSRAAALHGRRRRGMGAYDHQVSIGPRYTPVRSMGQFQQAAAGQVYQAAAGQFQQAAAGEYFTPMNATGEYFAPSNLQGVGAYEAAGQLAMPRNNQVITDGIRPDANLDREMSSMEAAAGMSGGVGSYYESGPGGQVDNVPTRSQWIPNGELWAGETKVDANQNTSELSAGILNVPGGNGILSG